MQNMVAAIQHCHGRIVALHIAGVENTAADYISGKQKAAVRDSVPKEWVELSAVSTVATIRREISEAAKDQ